MPPDRSRAPTQAPAICDAEPGSVLLVPGADGAVERVLFDIQAADAAARALYDLLKAR